MDLLNRWVHFHIGDVYLPGVEAVLQELYGNQILQGRVVDLSRGEPDADAYVVVRVPNLREPVVVAVSKVLGALE
jgi:hypothetical protein